MVKGKKWHKGITLIMILLTIVIMGGCQSESTDEILVEAAKQDKSEEVTELKTEEKIMETEEMPSVVRHVITDMVGREVEVPGEINRIFSVNNNGTILLYTLCPEMLIGWNSKISEESAAYMSDALAALPILGSLYGNSSQNNPEEVIMSEPDIILFMDASGSDKAIEAAEKLQKNLGIPVVMVKGGMTSYDKIYTFMGGLLGLEERAEELSDYHKMTITKVKESVAQIPEEEKVSVYYAREEDGLSTETSTSPNAELIELCGGVNVAVTEDVKVKSPIVSIEQVVSWNPQIIFTGSAGFISYGTFKEVTESDDWSSIAAVKEGKVYATPQLPFNWFDRPPSVNRIIGINYVFYTLYPEKYEGDIVADVQNFYSLFYHYDLNEAEAAVLVGMK